MLSIVTCQRILNQDAAPGGAYTRKEAERLRGVLYCIAAAHLEDLTVTDLPSEERSSMNPSLNSPSR